MELAVTIIFWWFLFLLLTVWAKKLVALATSKTFTQSTLGQFMYDFVVPLVIALSAGFIWG